MRHIIGDRALDETRTSRSAINNQTATASRRKGGFLMKNLLILGAGGFGRAIEELARAAGFSSVSFLDDAATGPNILGPCEDFARHPEFSAVFPAFGSNELRLAWIARLTGAGRSVPVLVHPAAFVSPSAQLGAGSCVLPMAAVHTGVIGGQGVLVNCGAVVDHDCRLGDGAHICIGALVKAGCTVAPLTKIEAGQVVFRQA